MSTYIAPAPRVTPPVTLATTVARWLPLAILAFVVVTVLFPEFAFAQDARQKIGEASQKAYDLVFTVVYWICAIAVIVSGLGATFGRMEWGRFGQIVAGIVVVFSSTLIVDYFQ